MNTDPLRPDDPAFDPLESRLARQPMRTLPPEWRRDLLDRAQAAVEPVSKKAPAEHPAADFSGWMRWIRDFPIAWSALAAVWLCILALHAAGRWLNDRPMPVHRISAVQWAELKRQRAELSELAGLRVESSRIPSQPESAPEPPAVLRPRSSRRTPQEPSWGRVNGTLVPEWALIGPGNHIRRSEDRSPRPSPADGPFGLA